MRHVVVKAVFVILSGVVSQAAAAQMAWDFVITDYPKAEGNCDAQAASIAEKLQKSYNIRLLKAGCERGYSTESQKLVVKYYSSNGYRLEGINAVSDHASAEYKDYDSCRTDLDFQVDLFRRHAGLEPLVSFCTTEYAPRLQIYYNGKPNMDRHALNVSLGGASLSPSLEYPEEIAAGIRDAANRRGMIVSRVRVEGEFYSNIAIYYYAKQPYRLGLYNEIAYKDINECETQLSDFSQLMTRLGVSELYSFCAQATNSPDGGVVRFLVGFVGSYGGTWLGTIELKPVSVGSYADYASCSQNLNASLAEFRQRSGRTAVAGICSLKSIEPVEYQTLVYH